jgi:hypothetical protein
MDKDSEPQNLPVVVVIGTRDGIRPMYESEPSPWNMRFMRRIGVEDPNKKRGYGF